VCAIGLAAVSASSFVALTGSVVGFATSFALLVLGVSNLTVAGHAWIGHRIAFAERSRAIGWYETSWAISLLVGAPVVAWLIAVAGWRGPYVVLGFVAAAGAVVVMWVMSPGVDRRSADVVATAPLPRSAWAPMIASASTAAAGLGVYVVSGAWLDTVHGIGTAGLGVVAAGFGIVELVSSGTVIAVGDRIGARRSVLVGLTLLGAGVVVMIAAGDTRWSAIGGLLVFLCGFEFAFVSSLTLVTEAAPDSRGRAIGISNALATVTRSSAVVFSGQLFEAFGMNGSLALAGTAWAAATVATLTTNRHRTA
jgi:predicted MFS family arabinose efflux permease